MTAESWQKIDRIFQEALDSPPGARAEFLDAACAGDAALRAEVESLLAADACAADDAVERISAAAAAAWMAEADPFVGQTVGPYEVERRLGEGGMGEVYQARDRRLGRAVALKLLLSRFSTDPQRIARFTEEARAASALNHPGIVTIHDLGEHAGRPFIATELIAGETLRERIGRGRLSIAECVDIGVQVASALAAAHAAGIVHRDIKPENIMVRPDGFVKVLDFGLAKLQDEGAAGAPRVLTQTGMVVGTPSYMSPEQARGEPLDARTDVFSLGVVLYEMLAGVHPFRAPSHAETIGATLFVEPPALLERRPDVPGALAGIVARAIAKDRARRYASAAELAHDLRAVRAHGGSLAPSPGSEPQVPSEGAATPREDSPARPSARSGGEPSPSGATAPIPITRLRARLRIAAVLVTVAICIAAVWWLMRDVRSADGGDSAQSIAVLPLRDLSAGQDQEYFVDGVTEELLNLLASNPRLRVVGRTSAFQFKKKQDDLRVIGRALNVGTVLEGSVRKSGSRVRITVQLVNAADGFNLWAETYDRQVDDILAVQDEIARSVAAALGAEPPGRARETSGRRPVKAPAHNAYLQGRYFLAFNTKEGMGKAVQYFRQAVELDPEYAPAWTGLSLAHSRQAAEGFTPVHDGYRRAREAVERALSLDPDLGEAHSVLGQIQRLYEWDFAAAHASSQRALQLDPGNANLLLDSARVWTAFGRLSEALDLSRRAVETDPLNVTALYRLARVAYFAGRSEEAAAVSRKLLELNPAYPGAHADLGLIYVAQSRPEAALAEVEQEKHRLWRLYGLAVVYHALGRQADADAALSAFVAEYQNIASLQIAELCAYRGEVDRAFEWLERAYIQRDPGLAQIKSSPHLKRLEGDPRYGALLDRMRLPR